MSEVFPGTLKPWARSSARIRPLRSASCPRNTICAGAVEAEIADFIDHDNCHRYHKSLGNPAPTQVYLVRAQAILKTRKKAKVKTIEKHSLLHRDSAA